MSIKVRTISTLPEISALNSKDFMEVSQYVSDVEDTFKYTSTKVEYGNLETQIKNSTIKKIKNTYNLDIADNTPANIKNMYNAIKALSSENIQIYGTKTFYNNPKIIINETNDEDVEDNTVTNVKKVVSLISKYGQQYSTASYIKENPLNVQDTEGKIFSGSRYTELDSDNKLYYWHIANGGKDSSYYEDDEGKNTIVINETGTLNIYGWLADSGYTIAQESWVALFTKIYVESYATTQWVPIYVVPWIQGDKSSIMQYVAFNNIPISKGSELKIMTGFAVNGKNSGLGSGNSLLFKEKGNIVNTFVGYVIEK